MDKVKATSSDDKHQSHVTTQQTEDEEKEKASETNVMRMAETVETSPPFSPSSGSQAENNATTLRPRSGSHSSRGSTNQSLSPSYCMVKSSPRAQTGSDEWSEEEISPGAVRVSSFSVETSSASCDLVSLSGEFSSIDVLPLTAEAVPEEDEDERIRELREDNEALRQRMQDALDREQSALEEVQTIARTPTANVAVFRRDAEYTPTGNTLPSQQKPQCSVVVTDTRNSNNTKAIFMMGCFCVCLVGITVGVQLGMVGMGKSSMDSSDDDDSTEAVVINRREYLKGLFKDLEPLHEEAFHWLTDVDEWQPDHLPGSSVEEVTRSEKEWMWFERYFLTTLYYSTNGDSAWDRTYTWLSPTYSHCSPRITKWFGVRCENDAIVSIDLEANLLDGTIPADIRLLESLGFLCMGEQNLTGTIPALPASLTTLKLENNQLTGTVPVLPNLTACDLSGNNLVNTTNGAIRGCFLDA
ncbi:MAG: hypothetical protein SGBAC_008877 [Bacillariaceae sp.]